MAKMCIRDRDKKELISTPEGDVLIKYARRAVAVESKARQAVEDCRKQQRHLTIGITQTAGENLMPQVIALYCGEHPDVHINIRTDTIKKLYRCLELYELDIAVVEGVLPNPNFNAVLLDTDYLCLVVSPRHPFARRQSVELSELKGEKLIPVSYTHLDVYKRQDKVYAMAGIPRRGMSCLGTPIRVEAPAATITAAVTGRFITSSACPRMRTVPSFIHIPLVRPGSWCNGVCVLLYTARGQKTTGFCRKSLLGSPEEAWALCGLVCGAALCLSLIHI